MISNFLAVMMIGASAAGGEAELESLLSTIEALQVNVHDFRCEYEGTLWFRNPEVIRARNLDASGLYDTFSGVYIWSTGGDAYVDAIHRYQPEARLTRELLIVRAKKKQAEHYLRADDAPVGSLKFDDPEIVNPQRTGCVGELFVLPVIRRLATRKDLEASITSETLDGRDVTVLTFSTKSPKKLLERFWLDMKRGGHAVRREAYSDGAALVGRIEIRLKSFKVGDEPVWLPVSGSGEGHAVMKDGKIVIIKEPNSMETIGIVDGSLEFNKYPGPHTFEVTYKPGTRVSDNLRQLQYEYGQQKQKPRATKADAQAQLQEQVARAEEQRKELVAGSPLRDGPGWTSWLVWIFGASSLVFSVLVLVLRGRR